MAASAEPSLQILGREDVAPIDLAPAPEDDAHMLLLKRAAGFGDVRCVAPVLHPTLARFVVNASDGEKMYERLDEALRLLDVCNVEHWLCAGTLLGQCRHGGIIPWDDDVDLAVGPLDAPRLGEALAAHLPDAGWAFERTFYGYKMWKGDRWPFVDLLTMEFDEASGNVRYAEAAAREAWPNEWWAVDELYPLRCADFGPRRSRVRRVKAPAPGRPANYLARAYTKDWKTVARTPVWDHRRDRWHDDAKRGHAAESVELKAADRVPLGHRSLDDVGGAEYAPPPDDGAAPTPTIGHFLEHLEVTKGHYARPTGVQSDTKE